MSVASPEIVTPAAIAGLPACNCASPVAAFTNIGLALIEARIRLVKVAAPFP
jgi:hypothetical protein